MYIIDKLVTADNTQTCGTDTTVYCYLLFF